MAMVQQHNYNVLNTESHSCAHIPISFQGCSQRNQYKLKLNYRLTEEKYEMQMCLSLGKFQALKDSWNPESFAQNNILNIFETLNFCPFTQETFSLLIFCYVSYYICEDLYLNLQKSVLATYCAFLSTKRWGLHLLSGPSSYFSLSAKLLQTPTTSSCKRMWNLMGKGTFITPILQSDNESLHHEMIDR